MGQKRGCQKKMSMAHSQGEVEGKKNGAEGGEHPEKEKAKDRQKKSGVD